MSMIESISTHLLGVYDQSAAFFGGFQPSQKLPTFKDSLVTIYENTTQFADYFEIPIHQQTTTLVYEDILPSMDYSSAFVALEEAEGNIESLSFEKKTFAFNQFLQKQIGQKIKLSNSFGLTYEGILLQYSDKGYILHTDKVQGGMLTIKSEDVQLIQINGLEQAMSLKPSLKATYITEAIPEKISGQVVYLAKELDWRANYRLILEEVNHELQGTWISEAQITNLSDRSFKDLTVRVVAGKLNEQGFGGAIPTYKAMRAMCQTDSMNGVMIGEDWQDLKAYILAKKVSLAAQETLFTKLYEPTTTLQVKKTYVLKSNLYDNGFRRPRVCYHVPNHEQEGLNQPIPKGNVQVYQKDQKILNYLGASHIEASPKGEDLKIYTSESFDLGVKRAVTISDLRNDSGQVFAQDVKVTFELSNQSDQDQTILLSEMIANQIEILNSSILSRHENETVFEVSVPKNTSTSKPIHFSYQYRKSFPN